MHEGESLVVMFRRGTTPQESSAPRPEGAQRLERTPGYMIFEEVLEGGVGICLQREGPTLRKA